MKLIHVSVIYFYLNCTFISDFSQIHISFRSCITLNQFSRPTCCLKWAYGSTEQLSVVCSIKCL